ncbi:MAG TPA: class I SAM-dependent methyltransferase [Anaerolineae bacterium]|nr:class I SAM-dependent methyltransferase [Anaerolineae bacterium]
MNCCGSPNGLDKVFDESLARDDVSRYLRQGLDKPAHLVVSALAAQGIAGASVLEVGSGVGALHLELLKSGAARATSVDLAPAYIETAQRLAARLGFANAVEHHLLDFARQSNEVAEADVVVMNRVVCCYPDMPALVTAAAGHARRLVALTFPRDVWWMRLGGKLMNVWMTITRNTFRFYLHPPSEIVATVKQAGLAPVFQRRSGPWNIAVFRREH